MNRPTLRRAAAPLLLTMAAALATLLPVRPAPGRGGEDRSEDAPPATPEVLALLDGLRVGDALGDFRVRRIAAPTPSGRVIAVDLENAGMELTITIARRDALPHRAPRRTARYDLFYGSPRPAGRTLAFEAIAPLLEALAARIARVEERAPTPAGM